MKGLIFRCNRFEFKDTEKSTKPKGIGKLDVKFSRGKFKDVILILLCVEKDDREEYIGKAAKRIEELDEDFYKLRKVVVAPFVHLSRDIESPKRALDICRKLSKRLREHGFDVDEVTFGTHKSSIIDFRGHPAAVSYFEFP